MARRATLPTSDFLARLAGRLRQISPQGANELEAVPCVHYMVENELIYLAARNFSRRKRKRIARQLDTRPQRCMEEVGIAGLRHAIGKILRGRCDHEQHADITWWKCVLRNRPSRSSVPTVKSQRHVKERRLIAKCGFD